MKTNFKPLRSAPVLRRSNAQTDRPPKICENRETSGHRCARDGRASRAFQRVGGFLEVDLVVGLAILTLAVLPLGFAFAHERQALRMEYCRSVANEIVDGEMEILAAGAAKNLPDGAQSYSVHANALSQLPPGHFQLTKTGSHLRLEWQPDRKHRGGPVVRETTLK
jgi:hypothetical protein